MVRTLFLGVGLLCCALQASDALAAPPAWFAPLGINPITGSSPQSVAVGDIDGDARPDLVVANRNSDTISVIRNTGNFTFAAKVDYATASSPNSVAISDVNADGRLDLAVACNGGTISILLNNGGGTFAPRTDYSNGFNGTSSLAIGDLDADGSPDLAVASANSFSVGVLRNNGDGTFAPRVNFNASTTPAWVSIRDLDADGKLDLAVLNVGNNRISLLLNASAGPGSIAFANQVQIVTNASPSSVSTEDLNADGKPDLVVPNANSNTISVFISTSSGPTNIAFAPKVDYAVGLSPRAASIRDLDNDGWPDIAVANFTANTLGVLRNNGDGTFAAPVNFTTGSGPSAIAFGDLDADGRPEVVLTNSNAISLTILRNKGSTVFVRAGLATGLNDGSSWANAYRELRTALTDLDTAPWIHQVWVARGTYTPAPSISQGGDRNATFSLLNNLTIYGGFFGNETLLSQRNIAANPTVLSGDLNNDDAPVPFPLNRGDNAFHVVTALGNDPTAILDGVTIRDGYANAGLAPDGSGAGMLSVGVPPSSARAGSPSASPATRAARWPTDRSWRRAHRSSSTAPSTPARRATKAVRSTRSRVAR